MSYFRPSGFSSLPPVVKNLLIINGLIFLFLFAGTEIRIWMMKYLALWMPGSDFFIPTQYVTYQFMHSFAGPFHLLFNMFALWMFGTMIENIWGARRFLTYYLLCGIGAGLTQTLAQLIAMHEFIGIYPWAEIAKAIPPTVGASGSIYGLLVAYAFLFPDARIYIYFLIPMKAKYFVILLIAISLFSGLGGSPGDNVAHFAHLGGALTGILLIFGKRLFKRRRY
ncbi:MAG: rhomboid family intramembrane serine protease [Candidatus Competibacteraceae bacterium]|nr:rhomboid family intramembrane serine protease [Candidatus Competibacteraceae bacterium]